jgi:glycerate 2-kinase
MTALERRLRRDARSIFREALQAADPRAAVVHELRRTRLDRYRRIFVIGAGKASAAMAEAAESVLGRRISGGLINTKHGHLARLRRIGLNECGHPVPDTDGVRGARQIFDIAASAERGDLVICLISGGASALTPLPAPGVTLAAKQETTRSLLACGATIHEINAVRKHLSTFKGGQLARAAFPADVLSLILSDVIGDPIDVIGSGPTAPDSSTLADARAVLRKYGIRDVIPANAVETPKPDDPLFRHVRNVIVGSNRLALDAAARKARSLRYRPLVLSTVIEGETREVAGVHAAVAREVVLSGRPVKAPACLISGGETTVTLHGNGLGGRNQEFVLAAAIALNRAAGTVVFSAGTDGTDGPTDAAGAIAGPTTLTRAHVAGLDAVRSLASNDSYPFFDTLHDLVKTGPTGTNVMDVRLILVVQVKASPKRAPRS